MKIDPATTWGLPGVDEDRPDREIRLSDFLLFAVLPWAKLNVFGLPVNEVAALSVLALSFFRTPMSSWRRPPWFAALLLAILTMMLLSAALSGVHDVRRLGHLVGWMALAACVSSGRVSGRSAGLGLAVGLIVCQFVAVITMASSSYAGRLTGFFADPNGTAFILVVLGCVAIANIEQGRWQVVVALLTLTCVVLTYSRTGLLASTAVVLWVALGRFLGPLGGALLAVAAVRLTATIPDSVRLFGPFESRQGSDELRQRIIAVENRLLETAPWSGHGPGTSHMLVQGDSFYFHNSFLAARNEGGYLLLGLILALIALTFVSLSRSARHDVSAAILQASLIGVVIMALTLGEVLLELPTAVALGFAMRKVVIARAAAGEAHPAPEQVAAP